MPTPRYMENSNDPTLPERINSEIIGTGEHNRKAHTYLKDDPVKNLIANIGALAAYYTDLLRDLHAREHTIKVTLKDENGEPVKDPETGKPLTKDIPEVLTDQEIIQRYRGVRAWHEFHREHVAHAASLAGFSVNRVTGYQAPERRRSLFSRREGSGGTDTSKDDSEAPAWR